jgi:integrase/recombinase XerC
VEIVTQEFTAARDGTLTPSSRAVPGAEQAENLLTSDEARALIRAASNRAPTGVRNRAMIALMYRSGLRPGEALGVCPWALDVDRGTLEVPARKGGIGRVAALDDFTIELIQRWIVRRERIGATDDRPLLCTLAGEPIKAAYVRELLPRLARKASITKRVHPLGLRYACAAEMALEGHPTTLIETHLGVAVSGSARRYTRTFTLDEVIAVIRQRQWSL